MKCLCGCGGSTNGKYVRGHNRRMNPPILTVPERIAMMREIFKANKHLKNIDFAMTYQEVADIVGISQQQVEQEFLSGLNKYMLRFEGMGEVI